MIEIILMDALRLNNRIKLYLNAIDGAPVV